MANRDLLRTVFLACQALHGRLVRVTKGVVAWLSEEAPVDGSAFLGRAGLDVRRIREHLSRVVTLSSRDTG